MEWNYAEAEQTLKDLYNKDFEFQLAIDEGWLGDGWSDYNMNSLLLDHGIELAAGAAKAVMIFPDRDYVIKLPFVDSYVVEQEPAIYNSVPPELQQWLAKPSELGSIELGHQSFNYFLMERAEVYSDTVTRSISRVQSERDPRIVERELGFQAVAGQMDEDQLCEFIDDLYDSGIYDLHRDNVGEVDGIIKIIDYSDFDFDSYFYF